MLSYRETKADTACNLECVENLPPVREFVGKVKIVMVDVPKDIYKRRVCVSAFIALAHILMGATVITIFYFTISFKSEWYVDFHILACTLGYQLLIPSGIMMMSNLHGPSSPMKPSDRKCQHMLLQLFGLAFAAVGSVLVLFLGGLKITIHSIAGLAAGGCSAIAALQGPIAYGMRETNACGKLARCLHSTFGMPAFLASSVCFVTGLMFSENYENWTMMREMLHVPVLFCIIYTLIVLYTPLTKYFNNAS